MTLDTIYLRQNDEVTSPEFKLTRPLTNSEIDSNFQYLNKYKVPIDDDGKGVVTSLFFVPSSSDNPYVHSIWRNSNNEIQINGNVNIAGTLTYINSTTIEAEVFSNKTLILDDLDQDNNSIIDDIFDANGAGFKVGQPGYLNFTYDHSETGFKTFSSTAITTGINLLAYDFKAISPSGSIDPAIKSLRTVTTQLNSINSTLATNGESASNSYTSTNVIANNDSLKVAIEKLDGKMPELGHIRTFVGKTAENTENPGYTSPNTSDTGLGITGSDSLLSAINKINSAMLYVVHTVTSISSSESVKSGRLYRVIPSDLTPIVLTLPSDNRGIVVIRLEDDSNNKSVNVQGGFGNLIEDLDAEDVIQINVKYQPVQFIWDNQGSKWRVI